jgi:hypothetical protein
MPDVHFQVAALTKKQKSAETLLAGKLEELKVCWMAPALFQSMMHLTVSCRRSGHVGAAAEQKTCSERKSYGRVGQARGT